MFTRVVNYEKNYLTQRSVPNVARLTFRLISKFKVIERHTVSDTSAVDTTHVFTATVVKRVFESECVISMPSSM